MNKLLTQANEISLEKLRKRDRAEFAKLVEAYSAMIYRLALKLLADPQDAEDVLQETFMKAFHHLPEFDGRSQIATWLYRIAVNEALMLLRRKKPGALSIDEPSEEDDDITQPIQIVDWCCLPENELLSAEARAYLDRAVAQLSPNLRAVFLLRDVEGLSTQQTAEALNLSETAVKTRLSRARLRLREALSAYYGERMHARSSQEGESA